MNQLSGAQGHGVQQLVVEESAEGQRIDNFLRVRLKGVPKSRIYRILRRGEVRVNKGRIRQDYRLRVGDVVRIPPLRQGEAPAPAAPGEHVLGRLRHAVLHEDDALLVLDKPSGLAVHGGSGLSYGAIEALRAMRPGAPMLELVHRLDRETSGCLMVAKKRSALRSLHAQLRENALDKTYLALVRGRWDGNQRRVDIPLYKNLLRSGERVVVPARDGGKDAVSIFRPVARGDTASLVSVTLLTGRTHQIRVHAAAIGHPLAGDEKYGDPEFNRRMRENGLNRLFLHAWRLAFAHPGDGRRLRVEAEPAPELIAVLSRLGLSMNADV